MTPNDIFDPDPIITTALNDVNLLNPSVDSIDILEIVKSLSGIIRYGGHIPTDITVLQHLLICDGIAEAAAFEATGWLTHDRTIHSEYVRLYILLHDAAEAYTGDIVRPLKRLVNKRADGLIDEMEEALDQAILSSVCGFEVLTPSDREAVAIKAVDNAALAAEVHTLWPSLALSGRWGSMPADVPAVHKRIVDMVMSMTVPELMDAFLEVLDDHVGAYREYRVDGLTDDEPEAQVEEADPIHDVDTSDLVAVLTELGYDVCVLN